MAYSIQENIADKEVLTTKSIDLAKEVFCAKYRVYEPEEIMHVDLFNIKQNTDTTGVSSIVLQIHTFTCGSHNLELPLSTYCLQGDDQRFKDGVNGAIEYIHKVEVKGV